MNEKINLDLKAFKFIFNKNKSYIYPITIIFVSLILFLQFVIPQFGELLKAQKEAKITSQRIETLKKNLDIISNVDREALDSQTQLLSTILPRDKDFVSILNSIYSTAQNTGVNLGNFSFKVGDLSKSEDGDKFPVVKMTIPISSDMFAIKSFIEAMGKVTPLSEVNLIKVGEVSSTVGLYFYYKPLSVSVYDQFAPISPVSQKGLNLINQLTELGDASPIVRDVVPEIATPSSAL